MIYGVPAVPVVLEVKPIPRRVFAVEDMKKAPESRSSGTVRNKREICGRKTLSSGLAVLWRWPS
jgi:hypothetical protein